MKSRSGIFVLIPYLIVLGLSAASPAETKKAAPWQENNSDSYSPFLETSHAPDSKGSRKIAGLEPSHWNATQTDAKEKSPSRSLGLSLGILGGFSQIDGIDTGTDTLTQTDRNISLGLNAELSFLKYFSMELDLLYGIALSQEYREQIETQLTQNFKRNQLSGFSNLKARLPLSKGSFRLAPVIGIGWGISLFKDTEELIIDSESTTTSRSTQMAGPFAMAGFDIEPFSRCNVSFDYSHSFNSTGNLIFENQNDFSQGLMKSSFQRLRTRVSYLVTPQISLGIQYSWNKLFYNFPSSSESSSNSEIVHNQFLGLVSFGF